MQLHSIALPVSAPLYLGEEQDFSLYLSEKETFEVKSLLAGNLVVLVDDAAVNFFLGNKELGFSFAAIKHAKLSVIKEEGKVWIVLMATLLKTNNLSIYLKWMQMQSLPLIGLLSIRKS